METLLFAWVLLRVTPKPDFRLEQCKLRIEYCDVEVHKEYKTLNECKWDEVTTEKEAYVCQRKSFD